ncbi:MAG: hypothetical protein IPJ17_05500 [Holophagales bacterium]|nr:MAG: hypothetical protein IPJ17_05500 [Holophagales bacterium]
MYIAQHFNQARLFQRVAAWDGSQKIDVRGHQPPTALLLHRASAAFLFLERMAILANACRAQFERFRSRLALATARISFWSPALAELLFELSPFLTTMVVLQNSLLAAAASQIGRPGTVPASLNEFLKKRSHYTWFDGAVATLLQGYWDDGGRTLRDFRDVDQHFYVLTQHSFLDLGSEPALRIFLPDNPDTKSPRQFTFAKEIDALTYCQREYSRFHDLTEAIAAHFGFEPAPHQQPLSLYEPYQVQPQEQPKTVALVVMDFGRFEGIELGQVAGESTMFVRQLAKPEGGG